MKDIRLEKIAREAPLSEAAQLRVISAAGIAEAVVNAIVFAGGALRRLSGVQRAKAKHHRLALHNGS